MVVVLLTLVLVRYLLFRNGREEMYKAYLASQNKKAEPVEVDPVVKKTVDRVWKEIENQCHWDDKVALGNRSKNRSTDWKIVRLFVSSTFADFFNEREVLVKKVFPELREWCLERNLKLVECDLRWGVPKDTPSGQTVSICLEEIDKCIEVSDGCPLFIGLLGDRYGWMPSKADIIPEVREKYEWVDETSITCMEVLYGAYRTKNPNAAFFIRNPSVYSNIPDSHVSFFVDKDPLASHNLKVLKEKITAAFPNQMFHFEPKFKMMSEDVNGKKPEVVLEGFDDFAKNVLDFFKSAILRIHPEQNHCKTNPLQREQDIQWYYVLDKSSNLIGRQTEKDILVNYLKYGTDGHFETTVGAKSQMRKLDEWEISDSDRPLCVVEAPSGWGKTTLMSSVIRDIVQTQKDWKVFYHVVGSSPSSIQLEWLLKRLLSVLIPEPNEEDKTVMEEGKVGVQKERLRKALADFRNRQDEKLIIILDNLNGLSNSNTTDHLSWLPPCLPPNIRCLVSTNQHLPTLSRLFEHPTLKICLSTLSQEDLAVIAMEYLGTFSKKLHPSQLKSLMTTTKVDNPLWLTFMVEELRIFGSFSQMDQRIAELPTSMNEFLVQVFDRLVREDQSQDLVKKVLCLIACSRYGIPADQVLQICGDAKSKEPVALLDWLQVKRSLKPYLRMSGFLEEMITFSHDAVRKNVFGVAYIDMGIQKFCPYCDPRRHLPEGRFFDKVFNLGSVLWRVEFIGKAVIDHFLSTTSDICHWHTVLADYFQFWCDNPRAKVWNLTYHLKKAQLHARMVQFLRTDKHSFLFLAPFQRSNFLKDCRCHSLADPVLPHISPLMICPSCSNRPFGFNPALGWPNKDCCVICGDRTTNPIHAYACSRHAQRRGPDLVKCVLCLFNVNVKGSKVGGQSSSPALLCLNCSSGNGRKTCAVLIGDK